MKNTIVLLIGAISSLAMANGGSSIGPGNPASINCLKLGGKLERYNNSVGQGSNCVIEEWKLYNEMNQRGLVRAPSNDNIGMPNPASVNCVDSGGKVRIESTRLGEFGYCEIEEWTLLRVIDVTGEQ